MVTTPSTAGDAAPNGTAAGPDGRPKKPAGGRGRLIRIAVAVVVLGLSVWYVAHNINWDGLATALLSMNVAWVLAGVLATLGAHLARAQRWRLLIPNGAAISITNSFSAVIIGYFMNNVIPRSGELVRPYVLSRRTERPMSGLVATVLVERILDGLTLALLFVALLVAQRDRLSAIFPTYSSADILVIIVAPIVAIAIAVVVLIRTSLGDHAARLLGRVLPQRFAERITQLLHNFRTGITFGGIRGQLAIVFWSVVIWAGYAAAVYFSVLAFGLHTAYGIGPIDAVMVLAITAVGVTIAPTPGAFGVYHGFCKAALTSLFAIPDSTAIAFALVTHAAPFLAVMLVGSVFLIRENISLKSAMAGA